MDNFTWIAFFKVLATGLISSIIAIRTIPTINNIARIKGLLNIPGERTSHRYKTPNLAGIAIFLSACVSSLLFIYDHFEIFKMIYLASVIIFFTGLKDDILLLSPWKKLLAQIVVATLIVAADLRFIHFFGLFGVDQFNEVTSIIITMVFIVGIINAVNLIDGIDGLAAAIGVLILGFFGLFFFLNELYSWSIYCASMVGALIVFFQYNVFGLRNKTFMGDSGSLLLGLSIAVTTILFWEAHAVETLPLKFVSAPAMTLAIIIVPVFDVVRVFVYRIAHRVSPFSADRNHLHHRLVDSGFTHFQTTLILTGFNVLMIGITFALSLVLGTIWTTIGLIALTCLFVFGATNFYRKEGRKEGRKAITT